MHLRRQYRINKDVRDGYPRGNRVYNRRVHNDGRINK